VGCVGGGVGGGVWWGVWPTAGLYDCPDCVIKAGAVHEYLSSLHVQYNKVITTVHGVYCGR
jgi:hypothetical protein